MSLELIQPTPGEYFMKCDKCGVTSAHTTFRDSRDAHAFTPSGWSRVKITSLAVDPFADDLYMDYCYDCTNTFQFMPDRV